MADQFAENSAHYLVMHIHLAGMHIKLEFRKPAWMQSSLLKDGT
jgi:hypothetical protein